MKNLKTIEAKVKAILQKNEDARNDDMTLYLIVCNTYLKGAGAMPFAEVMEQYKYLGLPSFESVGRTRRKLQAKYPELAGNARVRRLRAEGEKAYRKRSSSIVGKVVVINAEPKRYEYQHPAFQLVLADGGNGATGGRGNAVFGTCLATGEKSRWERYDVLGEIKPECMPDWAKEALAKIKEQQKEKKQKNREER